MLTNNLPLIHFPTIEHLTAAIAEGRDELEQLCHQAKNTEDPHEEYYLSVHINQLSKDLDSYASILSPLRGMPPELIGEIFMQYHALTAPSECPFMKEWRAGQRGRWILSAVCQSWRAIATSLPALWTEVSIYLDVTRNGIGFTRMYPVSVLRTALERSGKLPIDVTFDCGLSPPNLSRENDNCSRWRSMTFRGEQQHLVELFRVKGRLPNLEALHLEMQEVAIYDTSNYGLTLSDAFAVAPKLRVAFTKGYSDYFASGVNPAALGRHQLEAYGAVDISPRHLDVLRVSAFTLTQCCLGTPFLDVAIGDVSGVLLPSLFRLAVAAPNILDYITAPALKELYLSGGGAEKVVSLLQRSSFHLETLAIYESGCDTVPLIEILENTPSLRHLGLKNQRDSTIFTVVAFLSSSGRFAPNLEYIAVEAHRESTMEQFFDMVATRWTNGRLRSVGFVNCHCEHSYTVPYGECFQIVLNLQAEGLQFREFPCYASGPLLNLS
ncbi:hypothetical protein C8J57DRAFT_1579453 [Mycena rebaudengoi]|nr:hypothetical protein C8J57DRAFT_1579453 [Mycena rebaudengoi]